MLHLCWETKSRHFISERQKSILFHSSSVSFCFKSSKSGERGRIEIECIHESSNNIYDVLSPAQHNTGISLNKDVIIKCTRQLFCFVRFYLHVLNALLPGCIKKWKNAPSCPDPFRCFESSPSVCSTMTLNRIKCW